MLARPRVAIVGGGTMGLAAAWALCRDAAASVDVYERFAFHHAMGSHSGDTRIIRHAYHEGADYVAWVSRSAALWRELEARSGRSLLVDSGVLVMGREDDPEFQQARESCAVSGMPFESLDAAAIADRWPIQPQTDWSGIHGPGDGYLRVARCFRAFADAAEAGGARLLAPARVEAIDLDGQQPSIQVSGEWRAYDRVILCAGAYAAGLLGAALPVPLQVQRRVIGWSAPEDSAIPALSRMPVWAAFSALGFVYGFPYLADEGAGAGGLKVARHAGGPPAEDKAVDPERVTRDVSEQEKADLQRFLMQVVPTGRGPIVRGCTCLYTHTPSGDFLIDRLPEQPSLILALGFSGHGFKFAPVVGEALRSLALDEAQPDLLPRFGLDAHLEQA